MPAQLVALNDGPNILLDKPILLLGRHPECDIQIDSRKISRRHCCIAQVSDYLVVRDLGSTNGVRINGVRVTEGRLSAGDELTIGNNRYHVAWDADFAATPADKATVKPGKKSPEKPVDQEAPEDFLESSEQPIALDEPGQRTPHRSAVPSTAHKAVKKEQAKHPPTSPTEVDESVILPEQLDLAPNDPFPAQPPSSPSHH
jgi:predicted component of type VI protein secretion system